MADRKISDLTALTTPASGDYLPIVDISEVAAASKNKRITIQSLFQGIPVNVGIGTSSPAQRLTVLDNSTAVANGSTLTVVGGTFNSSGEGGSIGFSNDIRSGVTHAARIRSSLINLSAQEQGNLCFDTNDASGLTERMRITSAGNVGIGTTSPNRALEVNAQNGVNNTSVPALRLKTGNVAGAAGYGTGIDFTIQASNNAEFVSARIESTYTDIANQFGDVRISTMNTGTLSEKLRIDPSGRLLVGTSSTFGQFPDGLFVNASAGNTAQFGRFTNDNVGGSLIFFHGRGGAPGTRGIVQNGDLLGYVDFIGDDGVTLNSTGARISAEVDGTPGTDDMPGRLVFSTTADGASTTTERLRITSAGVLQVADAGDIAVGTTTGTKIGTATTQKLGFYNATPVVQPTAVADATDAATVITQLNALLAKLRTLGIIAT
jgi:hypothetical protein